MAKVRMINTRFWNDSFISTLDPVEKLLFIYFLTNEHTNICGIYELPLKIAAIETGIDESMFKKVLVRLKVRIMYIDGWVCILNFLKHQAMSSDKTAKGVEVALSAVPSRILEKAVKAGYGIEGASMPHTYPSGYSDLNSNTNPNSSEKPDGGEVNEFISLFKDLNPTYQLFYKKPVHRLASERLLKIHPLSWWSDFIPVYTQAMNDRYCPRATTPQRLEEKLGDIEVYGRRKNNEKLSQASKVAFS